MQVNYREFWGFLRKTRSEPYLGSFAHFKPANTLAIRAGVYL